MPMISVKRYKIPPYFHQPAHVAPTQLIAFRHSSLEKENKQAGVSVMMNTK